MNSSIKRPAKEFYKRTVGRNSLTGGKTTTHIALAEMIDTGDGVNADVHLANKYYLLAADKAQP